MPWPAARAGRSASASTQRRCHAAGAGRYQDALASSERAAGHPEELWSSLVLPELIEAAIRNGKAERSAVALQRLVEATRASDTGWALAIEARSRALLGEGHAAGPLR
jgi:hypothetical protein